MYKPIYSKKKKYKFIFSEGRVSFPQLFYSSEMINVWVLAEIECLSVAVVFFFTETQSHLE